MFQIQTTSIILLTRIDDIQPDADRARKSSETLPIYQVHKLQKRKNHLIYKFTVELVKQGKSCIEF